jgi:F420-0:gamma-glutamyl ligase
MRNATNRAGTPDASRKGRKSGIEALEQALGKEYASRMQDTLHYDDIQRFSSVGACVAGFKPVRDEDGKIDVLATFKKAGISYEDKTVSMAEMIKGGLF